MMQLNPYTYIEVDGARVPLFMLTFDKAGSCTSRQSLQLLLEKCAEGAFEHVHVYAHGWNNVFEVAAERFKDFFTGYLRNRSQLHVDRTPLTKTAFVGIIWPSTALVAPSERTPEFAGDPSDELDLLVEELPIDVAEMQRLTREAEHSNAAQKELAKLLLPIFQRSDDDVDDAGTMQTAEDVIRVASVATAADRTEDGLGNASQEPRFAKEPGTERLDAAALQLDPRWIVRIATVLLMKDRAGVVGAGVGKSLLHPLLEQSPVKVHGVGHSYGTKVMLSAICSLPLTRSLSTLLLLEPAISRYCFAVDANGKGTAGAYRVAFDRVATPIFSTWSSNDRELRYLYQLAAIRPTDPGELRALALLGRYEALGGYGPDGLKAGEKYDVDMAPSGHRYPLANARIYSLNGSDGAIRSHGDVSNDYTAWAQISIVDEVWAS